MIREVTSNNFGKEVLRSDLPVLVDFWAPWCGPCRMFAPVVEAIADHYKEKLKVVKLDIDDNADVARRYGIRSVPTLLLVRDGKVSARIVGVRPRAQIEAAIDKALGTASRRNPTTD